MLPGLTLLSHKNLVRDMATNLHVVMIPWSAFGHLIPFFQLSLQLAKTGIKVSFISTPVNIKRLPKVPSNIASLLHLVALPQGCEATVDIPFEKKIHASKAFTFRTCPEYEAEYLNSCDKITEKPMFPIGLLLPEGKTTNEIFGWLDAQKPKSVVFIECKLSKEQIHEIAYGVELSAGFPFLWALRSDVHALPSGFSERAQGRVDVQKIDSIIITQTLASTLETGSDHAPYDEALMLKIKSLEVEPYLNGRSIYLVGLMGSGKTTVGKVLSHVLGYSFYDSDALIEQEANGMSVAEIFKLHGESFFRKKETEILQRLSSKKQVVVSTGGGAVVQDENWDYMQKKGIVVWLDVPVEVLAQRIAAVGTHSRPLLHNEHGDTYTKALKRLSCLLERRGKYYAKADARVSLEGQLRIKDVSNLTPTEIAIEALEQIQGYLTEEGDIATAGLQF